MAGTLVPLTHCLRVIGIVLELLRQNQLYAKETKCHFRDSQVEYLGHLISKEGVVIDPKKIHANMNGLLQQPLNNSEDSLGWQGIIGILSVNLVK